MKRVARIAVIAFTTLSLLGCQSSPNTAGGTLAGAVAGAAIGAATGSSPRDRRRNALIGAAIGAAVGGGIGAHFDRQDRERQMAAAYTATTTGRRSSWTDPSKGTGGSVEPIGYAQVRSDGRRCTTYRFEESTPAGVVNSGQGEGCIDRAGNFTAS